MRPTRTKRRLDELKGTRFRRGFLTLEERIEEQRLIKLHRQCERRRERYASDPQYAQAYRDNVRRWRARCSDHA